MTIGDDGKAASRDSHVLPVFAAAMLAGALLLFSVQPMVAKMLAPRVGGSPAVWAVSLCFFQGMLLLGYAYAYGLAARLPARMAAVTHLAALALAGGTLPFVLPGAWTPPAGGQVQAGLFALLLLSVGPAFLVASATAPLLQHWFSRTDHALAADPYFLYAASNIGSLAGLIAYPVLIEPTLTLRAQAGLWAIGFAVLWVLTAACAVCVAVRQDVPADAPRGGAPPSDAKAEGGGTVAAREAPDWRRRARWVVLSSCRPPSWWPSRRSSPPTSPRRRCSGSCRWRSS